MFKNFVTSAWRNLSKYRLYSLLNITGLAIGLTGSFLIFLFLRYELSYDKHFSEAQNIYRIGVEYDFSGKVDLFCNAPRPIAPTMKADYPQVKAYTRLAGLNGLYKHEALLEYDQTLIKSDQAFYADSSYFDVFDYEWISGSPKEALKAPNTIVLTQQMAQNVFGQQDPMGKQLRLDKGPLMTVSGIIRSGKQPTHMPVNTLVSWATQYTEQENSIWLGRHVYSYLLLQEGTGADFLRSQFDSFFGKYMASTFKQLEGKAKLIVQPLTSIHLNSNLTWEAYPNGNKSNIYLFSAIALILLLIAGFNYVNLSLAQSGSRSLEVGLRKVMGALPAHLIRQYLIEAVVIALIALVFVILFVFLALPQFRLLSGIDLSLNFFQSPQLFVLLLGITVLLGLLAGVYPAFVLSRFKTVVILKGGSSAQKTRLRKALVIGQFIVAVCLIISTLIVNQQIRYIQEKDLGFNKDNIMMIQLKDTLIANNIRSIRADFLQNPNILGTATSYDAPGTALNQTAVNVENKEGGTTPFGVQFMQVDHDFLALMEMELSDGRYFDQAFPADASSSIIINEAAAMKFGWGNEAVGKKMNFGPNPDGSITDYHTIGLIKDFNSGSLHHPIAPIIMILADPEGGSLFLRLKGQQLPQTIRQVEEKWASLGSAFPMEYTFLDQNLADQYLGESKLLHLLNSFAFLTLIISALGLFGLIALTAAKRKKEISIRKVLGASAGGLYALLSKEYIMLILMANILAWPLAYWGILKWLSNFAFRTDIGILPFIWACLLSFFVAILTISYQAIRVARSNPIKALRHE